MANDLLRGRQTVVPLVNKSGGGVVAGDVVILSSADASAFITTTSAAQSADWVGVALETIASNGTGRVCVFGYVPLVNLASSASLGDYIRTHTSAKQAQRFSSTGAGDFGQVLGTGTTPPAVLWGRPDQGTGGIRVDEVDGAPDVTGVTRITVSNGTLTDNTGGHVTLTTGGGGGGGSTISNGAFSGRPGSPSSGDLFLPSDALVVERYNGASWDPYGPITQLTVPPAASGFTWLNQGSATITEENDIQHLFLPKETGLNIRGRHIAAPATPYTITALLTFNALVVTQMFFGLLWRQSSDGKLVTAHIETTNTQLLLGISKWNSATSFSAAYFGNPFGQRQIWLRLEDDGTNRKVHFSMDGRYFTQIHTVGRTDFLTANQVGFFGIANTASAYDMHGTLLSWTQG